MAIVEHKPYGVITDGLYGSDSDIFLAPLQSSLAGAMAFDLGARRMDTQVFEAVVETRAIVEGDDKQA